MEFQGPLPADYENVRSLNRAFLQLLQGENGRRYFEGCSQEFSQRLRGLKPTEVEKLSATPFLLFSFREREDEFWQSLLADDMNCDLFAVPLRTADDSGRLIYAGLGFVWQLASRNPFAARLLFEASTHWCEQITERTFLDLLLIAGQRSDLLCIRARHDGELWRKLLDTGLRQEKEIRFAAQISALQYLLTCQPGPVAWQAAACSSRNPSLRVAEDPKT